MGMEDILKRNVSVCLRKKLFAFGAEKTEGIGKLWYFLCSCYEDQPFFSNVFP
jgi:hypothetical protein